MWESMKRKERWFKRAYRRGFWFLADRVMSEIDENWLKENTIVFSPHPDDETLGCGGTISRIRKLGGEVTIVVMTDGRRSHHKYMQEETLKSLRAGEASQANHILGGREDHLIFLEFEDGKLMESRLKAVQKIQDILSTKNPRQIFVPYYGETPSDHLAANKIVLEAMATYSRHVRIYQYPIWFWSHWPWIGLSKKSFRSFASSLKQSLVSGYRLAKDFRSVVDIRQIVQQKQKALDQYQTQMTRISGNPKWPILGDVADGEFLECFFQDREIFYRCQ